MKGPDHPSHYPDQGHNITEHITDHDMAASSSPRRLLGPSHGTGGEAGPNLNTSAEDEGVALNPVSGSGSQNGKEWYPPFKRLEKQSNGWTDWHKLCFTSADSSGNGHRINTSRPTIPQEAFGVIRGSQMKMSVEAVKPLDRLAPKLAHTCRSTWELIYTKQIAPRDSREALGGFRAQTFKSLGKLSNDWTDWHQLWFTYADSSRNGHRLVEL